MGRLYYIRMLTCARASSCTCSTHGQQWIGTGHLDAHAEANYERPFRELPAFTSLFSPVLMSHIVLLH